METHFASPERTDSDTLVLRVEQVAGHPVIEGVLDLVGGLVAVLDDNRQILAINRALGATLGVDRDDDVLGLRPGEAIGCVHAKEMPNGCGTARHCASCGAAIAIVSALADGTVVERTCCVEINHGGRRQDLYLSVRATRVTIGESPFVLLFLLDITAEQRRAALERTFNHDLRNVLSALMGCAELLSSEVDDNPAETAEMIMHQTERLQRELDLQQLLNTHDSVEFVPKRFPLSWAQIQKDLEESLAGSKVLRDKVLRCVRSSSNALITTDRYILARVLTNMVRNALEATPEYGEVKVWCEPLDSGGLDIRVWNTGAIPPETALRIFQRNFSTKSAPGRGLGTYSMKLLAERYLDGRVEFTTSAEQGTTFTVRIPPDTRAVEPFPDLH